MDLVDTCRYRKTAGCFRTWTGHEPNMNQSKSDARNPDGRHVIFVPWRDLARTGALHWSFPETQENEETIGYDPGLIYTDVFLIDIIFIIIYIYIYICLYMFMYIGYAK